MNFVAISPGVHSIDTLTLTDVESGFSTNLRYEFYALRVISDSDHSSSSVLDVVVHDPND